MSADSGFLSESMSDSMNVSQGYESTNEEKGLVGTTFDKSTPQAPKRKRGRPRTREPKSEEPAEESRLVKRKRGRPKGAKNKHLKVRPPPPPKRRRGRPRKTDPPLVVPIMEFPNRRRSGRLLQRETRVPSSSPLASDLFIPTTSIKMEDTSRTSFKEDTSLREIDLIRHEVCQMYQGPSNIEDLIKREPYTPRKTTSSSFLSDIDRIPLEPPENIFEDSNSSE